jgi:fatty-acyl-CoA synthase
MKVELVDRSAMGRGIALPTSSERAAPLVSAGPPLDETEIAIMSSDAERLSDREIGEIWVRNPGLMQGYVADADATNRVLAGGWLRTGDRGYLADGELYITGRIKDMVIVNGLNYYAEDLETIVENLEFVRKGACVAIGVEQPRGGESVVVVAEKRTQHVADDECVQLIKSRLWREVGIAVEDVLLLQPGTLPKTSSGKLRRQATKGMYEAGRFALNA